MNDPKEAPTPEPEEKTETPKPEQARVLVQPPVAAGQLVPIGGWWFKVIGMKDDLLVLKLHGPCKRTLEGARAKVKGRAPTGCSKRRHKKR